MTISRQQMELELSETQKDLLVFVQARDLIRRRMQEVKDEDLMRALPNIVEWTGSTTALGAMDMAIHSMERTVDELKADLDRRPLPRLRLVEDP